ncbi:MAG: hypothetical protein KAR54_02215 [Candidatus Pacebacteria bacterium]|nr:hypothetical protein [Candidatus Paceibacterota bacterium]
MSIETIKDIKKNLTNKEASAFLNGKKLDLGSFITVREKDDSSLVIVFKEGKVGFFKPSETFALVKEMRKGCTIEKNLKLVQIEGNDLRELIPENL